ncbi:MAG: F0F1 ATP synthase subunit delta [Gammaproteobacteria bacterium]|nr:F0F1 ATP synthase subunit delta [Gammaproteobacteria bacterium]
MADLGTIARPYAQAVFELAKAGGDLAGWSAFLKNTALAVMEPAVERFLATPGADTAAVAAVIAELAGRDNRLGANLLRVLAENRRLGVLPEILARYEALKAEHENTLDVTLTSALPVGAGEQATLVESLKKRLGRQVRLTVTTDAQLIGGARLQVGDRVIDGSVRTGLDKLATALAN